MWDMRVLLLLAVAAVAAGLAYIRLAPSDPGIWHQPLHFDADEDLAGGVKRVVEAEPDALAQLDAVARATPRTQILAGSVAEGRITYVTRSAAFGFPDYTTVQQDGTTLWLYGRSRFGRSDLGVNKARVARWLAALQAR